MRTMNHRAIRTITGAAILLVVTGVASAQIEWPEVAETGAWRAMNARSVRRYLNGGADPNARLPHTFTFPPPERLPPDWYYRPLHMVVRYADSLDAGAEVLPGALLMQAGYNSNAEVIRLLIDAGADVNYVADWDGSTPLIMAATFQTNPEIVQLLLEACADPNARDNSGESVLMKALGNFERNPDSNERIIRMLRDAGAQE